MVADPEELKATLHKHPTIPETMLVQEIIPGRDGDIYKFMTYVDSDSVYRPIFFYRKVRQNPPHFGVVCCGVSTELHPEVERLGRRLVDAAGYQGDLHG